MTRHTLLTPGQSGPSGKVSASSILSSQTSTTLCSAPPPPPRAELTERESVCILDTLQPDKHNPLLCSASAPPGRADRAGKCLHPRYSPARQAQPSALLRLRPPLRAPTCVWFAAPAPSPGRERWGRALTLRPSILS